MVVIRLPESVTPTLVKQYAYCPVVVWIRSWLMVEEPATDSMRIAAESLMPPKGRGQVYVRSKRGSTLIDEVVEENGGRVIVEKKAYTSYNQSRYVEQAVTSYIVARESLPGVRAVKLELAGKSKTIELSEDLVSEVEQIVKIVQELLTREHSPPRPGDPRKCTSCWYKRYCPYW